ncbi:MAG TPA: hypothetical protein VGL09_09745 [Methylomirabilota bacterium]
MTEFPRKVRRGLTVALALALCAATVTPAPSADTASARSAAQLGSVDFANSCRPAVQTAFQQAVAMLHSFWYVEAEKTFRDVLAHDPSCGIATWGIAATLMSNPLGAIGPSPPAAKRAQAAIEQGRRVGAGTPRERDYLEAVAAYYDDWANRPERVRQEARSRAFEALAARYPGDDEAQIFHALYLAATQSLADQTYSRYLKAAEILEQQFVRHPDHPGVAHYLIHSYDAPSIAARGLPAARRYASIAPAVPHALHMPSHIFTRVGAWAESAATNERAAAAARRDNDGGERLHAMDYMMYAYLQLGRDGEAKRVMEDAALVWGFNTARGAGGYAAAAIPARYALERGDWPRAAALEPAAGTPPFVEALTHFARAVGAARGGDAITAERGAGELARLRDNLRAANDRYWATEVEVSRLGAAAWAAWARGRHDEALELMRAAADTEDASEKHIVTPGRLLPARELLGDMLAESGRPAEARKEFEASHRREPDRFRGLYGAAQAAARSGDGAAARRHFARLVEVGGESASRPELAQARAFLAANP